jgi:hypothetical protein
VILIVQMKVTCQVVRMEDPPHSDRSFRVVRLKGS